MQDLELAQQIEEFIEVVDMELEPEPQDEDVGIMCSAPQIIVQSPPPPTVELTLREEGDIVPLDHDPVLNVYNLSYNELQKRIVQA